LEAEMKMFPYLFLGLLAATPVDTAQAETSQRGDAARRSNRSHVAPTPARVICGQTGCFDVPPGCRGEIRPSGHGVVAVVTCGR
jgi:hypothetical protein